MKRLFVIYHVTAPAWELMKDASLEDMQKGMETWMVWAAKCGDGLVDMGTPLGGGQTLPSQAARQTIRV